jgi:hypothetical protein
MISARNFSILTAIAATLAIKPLSASVKALPNSAE